MNRKALSNQIFMATSINTAGKSAGNSSRRNLSFYDATIGKKAVMAVTGVILFGFVLVHLVGNLQIFLPPDAKGIFKIDEYGKFLHSMPAVLWGARSVLIAAVMLHIWSSISLARMQRRARPTAYVKKNNAHSSYASRTMMLSGPIVACFIIYHLLHFTGGQVHPNYIETAVHHNVIRGLQEWPAAIFYIVAMMLLGTHLYHGLWSMLQSLGVSHPSYTPMLKASAKVFAFLIVVGNISIPISILLGIVK